MSPALTHCSNSATVGAGSEPVNPPIAITALPPLASSRLAALLDPSTAAAQRVVVFSSALSSADDGPAPPGLPPPPPGAPAAGPAAAPAAEVAARRRGRQAAPFGSGRAGRAAISRRTAVSEAPDLAVQPGLRTCSASMARAVHTR